MDELPSIFEENEYRSKDIGDLEQLRRRTSSGSDNDLNDDFPAAASVNFPQKDSQHRESSTTKGVLEKQGGNLSMNFTDYDEETKQKERNTPIIFQKAKFVMKPLNQFIEERPKERISLSNNPKERGSIKSKPANLGGILSLGFGKQPGITPLSKKSILSETATKTLSEHGSASLSQINTAPKTSMFQNKRTSEEEFQESNEEGMQIRNIFRENVDLKSKQVTPLFDIGPRYDKNSELLKYSIVGKPEWYKKVDIQKNGNKLTTKNLKNANGGATTMNSITKQNFDMRSMISKQNTRKNTMKVSEEQANIDGESGIISVVTKDHLLMKFAEIERRIKANASESEQKKFKNFQDQIDDSKQQRYLQTYEEQLEQWANTAASIVHRQDGTQPVLGLGALSLSQNSRRYHNYHRDHLEETLLIRSEDAQRLKKEQNEYLEYIKEPYEVVGQKHLWESMLRNDEIDITTKYSQKRKLKNYFFPREIQVPFGKNSDFGTSSSTTFTKSKTFYQSAKDQQTAQLDKEGNEIIAQDISPNKKSNHPQRQLSQSSSLLHPPASQKIDLTFRKSDFTNRELSNTNGARIMTGQNFDHLEVIRIPRIVQQQSLANHTMRSTSTKEKTDSIGQQTTFSGANISNMTSLNSEKKKWSIIKSSGAAPRQSYLDYFTQSELESIAIQGESKFESERNTIKNDGKQNFETYQLITIDEKKLKGGKSQKDLKDSQKLTPKPNEEQQTQAKANNAHVSFTSASNAGGVSRLQSSITQNK